MNNLDENTLTTLYAYLDNELSLAERQKFEQQLNLKPDLKIALKQEEAFRAQFRGVVKAEQAPESLYQSVNKMLADMETEPPPSPSEPRWWQLFKGWLTTPRSVSPFLAMGYTVAIVLLVSSAVLWLGPVNNIPAHVLEDHTVFRQMAGKDRVYIRQSPMMIDVAGSPGEVQTWFLNREVPIPFVPTLPDWHLKGGLLGEFHHQGVAHLIYEYNGQQFSLFVFTPQDKDFPSDAAQIYEDMQFFVGTDENQAVVVWGTPDIAYALVGPLDFSIDELLPLAKILATS